MQVGNNVHRNIISCGYIYIEKRTHVLVEGTLYLRRGGGLGEVPQLTRGVSTEVCWGRGKGYGEAMATMPRPCRKCCTMRPTIPILMESGFQNGVILSFNTLKICAKHMKECPTKVFARLLFVDLAYYQGTKDIVFRFIIEYSSLKDFGPSQIIIIGLSIFM